MSESPKSHHVCPYWLGYFLINPFRKFRQNPEKILRPHIHEGMTVLEIGPGMGFFSLTLAGLVGTRGKLICVDVQEKMLNKLMKRARKAGLEKRIEIRTVADDSLGISDLQEQIDCCITFFVIHEIPDKTGLFSQIREGLKPGGRLLIAEPKGHVSKTKFESFIETANHSGFRSIEKLLIASSHGMILEK
jgi:ubiquinone/menaquinone biosynthesis C-methylase UbiE